MLKRQILYFFTFKRILVFYARHHRILSLKPSLTKYYFFIIKRDNICDQPKFGTVPVSAEISSGTGNFGSFKFEDVGFGLHFGSNVNQNLLDIFFIYPLDFFHFKQKNIFFKKAI